MSENEEKVIYQKHTLSKDYAGVIKHIRLQVVDLDYKDSFSVLLAALVGDAISRGAGEEMLIDSFVASVRAYFRMLEER